MNFTEEEIKFMQKLRTKEMGYGNIARRVETVYRKKPTVSQVKEALATPKQKQAKTEIAAIPLPESLKEVVELRKKGVTYKEITNLTGFPYRQVRSICSVFVPNNSEISKSNMVRYKAKEKKAKKTKAKKTNTSGNLWSPEEEAELVSLREQGITYAEISKIMGRTTHALQQRFSLLKRTNQLTAFEAPVEVIETVEEPAVVEKKWANNRCNYSPQEELGILVDFHNLSIDQMRENTKGIIALLQADMRTFGTRKNLQESRWLWRLLRLSPPVRRKRQKRPQSREWDGLRGERCDVWRVRPRRFRSVWTAWRPNTEQF